MGDNTVISHPQDNTQSGLSRPYTQSPRISVLFERGVHPSRDQTTRVLRTQDIRRNQRETLERRG